MGISSDTALRELREQYNRLQDDFKSKLTEVAGLRADNEKLKQTAKDAEEAKKTIEDRLKDLEKRCKTFDVQKDKVCIVLSVLYNYVIVFLFSFLVQRNN